MQVPNVMAIERRKSKWQLRLALKANADDVDFLAPPSFTPVQLSGYHLGVNTSFCIASNPSSIEQSLRPLISQWYIYDLQVHRDEDGLTGFIAWSTRRRKHAHRSYHRLSLLHHLDTGHGMPASQCAIATVEHF